MPSAPGIIFTTLPTPPPGPAGTRTGTGFFTAQLAQGPVGVPISVQSLSDFNARCGGRQPFSPIYDALDLMFSQGLQQAWISRVADPAAAAASVILMDSAATPLATLVVTANSPGPWGNNLTVQSIAGSGPAGTYQLVMALNGAQVELSPVLTSPADAINWSTLSAYVVITNASPPSVTSPPNNNPAIGAAQALTGGVDNPANVTETQWTNALAVFTPDIGPGQVAAPGRTTNTAQLALIAHATANNRTYALDPVDGPLASGLISQAQAVQVGSGVIQPGQPDPGRGGMFAPWLIIAGLPTGTAIPAPPRVVPPSAGFCALVARGDAATGNPNIAAAGDDGGGVGAGVLTSVIGLTQPAWVDADRASLDAAGISVYRNLGAPGVSQVQLYGFVTLAKDPNWGQLSWQRLRMALDDEGTLLAAAVAQFAQIDGQGKMFAKLNGALSGMCQKYWKLGALYGDTAPQAYVVDTGPAVNTLAQIAQGIAAASISVHMSPFARTVQEFLIKVPLPQPV